MAARRHQAPQPRQSRRKQMKHPDDTVARAIRLMDVPAYPYLAKRLVAWERICWLRVPVVVAGPVRVKVRRA